MAIELNDIIPEEFEGQRLDQVLAKLFSAYSRVRLKTWIESGECLIDGRPWRPKDKVKGGEKVAISAEEAPCIENHPENIALDIVYEDDALIVINKPAGLVVHPAAGHQTGTLVNALLHHCAALEQLPRAGIVHRLDKDTTGVMVVAKTITAHTSLVRQLQARTVKRVYQAVVWGVLTGGGTVEQPIGRHPRDRIRMAVVEEGKPAVTHYRLIQKFTHHTHLRLELETGRTHQIRVHMAHLRYPIVGDPLYSGRKRLPPNVPIETTEFLQTFNRQALHAIELTLQHPETNETMCWAAPIPEDMAELIQLCQSTSDP